MKKNGFTLIELMIVVAILGIISAIAIPLFESDESKAEREQNVKTSATHMFRTLHPKATIQGVNLQMDESQYEFYFSYYYSNTRSASTGYVSSLQEASDIEDQLRSTGAEVSILKIECDRSANCSLD